MNELNQLFLSELSDVYSAESQLLKALPKMVKAAQSPQLRDALSLHLSQTEQHVERVKQVFELFGKPARAKKCEAMEGLIEEAKDEMSDNKGTVALDAAIIGAAQKVEHYEIASYGTLCTWAKQLGNEQAVQLLKQTLSEEETADKKLSELATQANLRAAGKQPQAVG